MYGTAIDRLRENIKWVVVAAGAVAVALIGTAPLSGAGAALSAGRLTRAGVGLFVAIAAVAMILLLAAWVLQPLEASLPFLTRRSQLGLPRWRHGFQQEYADNWVSYLDGQATTLAKYRDYRASWLGTLSDIDRNIERATTFSRQEKLAKYRKLAKERLETDTPNVALTLSRGSARHIGRRAEIAMVLITTFFAVAGIGFITYLGGAGAPPVITSLKASELKDGQPFTLTAQATGSGFTYTWWHEPTADPIDGANGPILTVPAYNDESAGTYRVRIIGADGTSADIDEIYITPPEPTVKATDATL
jgi:hypothetical protein